MELHFQLRFKMGPVSPVRKLAPCASAAKTAYLLSPLLQRVLITIQSFQNLTLVVVMFGVASFDIALIPNVSQEPVPAVESKAHWGWPAALILDRMGQPANLLFEGL